MAGSRRIALVPPTRHLPHRGAAVAVVGVAVDGGQPDAGGRHVDTQELAHQRLQRPRDRPVDHRREQRRQRIRQLLDDARAEVERLRVGHLPLGGRRRLRLGQRRDRAGLHDVELAVRARPLDVLRCSVVLLDAHAELGEHGGRLVVEHRGAPPLGGHRYLRRALLRVHRHHGLVRRGAGRHAQARLLDDQVVGGHRCRPPPTRRAPTRRESTTSSRRPLVGLAVNITPAASASTIRCTTTASADLGRVDPLPRAVSHGALGPQRRPALAGRRPAARRRPAR